MIAKDTSYCLTVQLFINELVLLIVGGDDSS